MQYWQVLFCHELHPSDISDSVGNLLPLHTHVIFDKCINYFIIFNLPLFASFPCTFTSNNARFIGDLTFSALLKLALILSNFNFVGHNKG